MIYRHVLGDAARLKVGINREQPDLVNEPGGQANVSYVPGRRNTMFRLIGLFLSLFLLALSVFGAVWNPGRSELSENWKLAAAKDVAAGGESVSQVDYVDDKWRPIRRMPATVLEILQEDGVYPNLYFGSNLVEEVPQDLYKQDWWYRTVFPIPKGYSTYVLEFSGINYRAEVWINGHEVANNTQVVGMYVAHEFNVTPWIKPGQPNALAIKITPEQAIQDVNGVELADSWFDWINWKFLGYHGEFKKPHLFGVSFVPDRNAGVWKPIYLKAFGEVGVEHSVVNTELSLAPRTARLTVYSELHNFSALQVSGTLKGTISRQQKPPIEFDERVTLSPGEVREIKIAADRYSNLVVADPDLWWPYTMGDPALYDLQLEFLLDQKVSDSTHLRFGIRSISQQRDQDEQFPDKGRGGNFYLKINGRDFRMRGGNYTPDLLYRYDPERESEILRYVKDLGINMLRWESKISSEHIIELADEQGIPLMLGWMCCNQWEKWDQWNEEDYRVAPESLRSQIRMLRPHASVFIWANASDGRPPEPVRKKYREVLAELHWENAVVDTVSAFAKDADGERLWDGINMEGPYTWRPPAYWFSGKYLPSRGSSVEQGDNEHIPTLESLKKFIPADRLWPINETWFIHAGAIPGANTLADVQLAVNSRYGPSQNVAEFVRKAQLAHYENTRAQFENLAAGPWANHKITLYWMLNSHWPSFYGNIIDYYLSPGGTYFGAKKGLRPLSVVFNAYALGDHSEAKIIAFNQTPNSVRDLRVRVRIYDLAGKVRDDRSATGIQVPVNGATEVMTLPRYPLISPVFFVRCQLMDPSGKQLVDNTYWQSQRDDDLGDRTNDDALNLKQINWADMTSLNTMPRARLEVTAHRATLGSETHMTIKLLNRSQYIAFFERAAISATEDGDELLPIQYDDNYVTVYPGETVEIHGTVINRPNARWVRLEGYNTPITSVPIQ